MKSHRFHSWLSGAVVAGCLLVTHVPKGRAASASESWPQFRGHRGDGHSPIAELPVTWSETNHVTWKTPIHGRAWSSPVVWGNQVWITTAAEDGRELFAIAVERDTGKVIHDLKLFTVEKPQFAHKFNTHASPTPVIEEGRIYVTFGAAGTGCIDTRSGKVLWERRDFVCNHYRGAGSSPILFGGLLIMNFDGSDHQFVVGLDRRTGETKWRRERSIDYKDLGPDGKPESEGDWRKAFSTPHIVPHLGRPLLISQGAKAVYAYDPTTGVELWRVEERQNHSASARPTSGHGMIFVNTGWSSGQLLALRPGRIGDVIDANDESQTNAALRVAWRSKRNVPKKPSLQLVGDYLFSIDDGGVASCLEALTGKERWRERIGGNYSASPLAAGDRIYFFSEEGKTTVIQAAPEFKKLAENTLADGFMASPAAAGKALFLRTKSHLYRIEN